MNRKLNPQSGGLVAVIPQPGTKCSFQLGPLHVRAGFPPYKMHVSATALAHPHRNGDLPQSVHSPAAILTGFTLVSAWDGRISPIPTKPESLYTPNDAKAGPGTKRPCAPPRRCDPLREVFSGAFLVHTNRRLRRTRRPPRPRRGERLDPDTQDPARPGGPSAAACAPSPSSRRRVQKCPFHVGALHAGLVFPPYKNARFSQETCTPPPEPARKSRCSQFTSCRVPVPPDSRPFQLWSSLERGGVQKCTPVPIPVHPNDITEDAAGAGA